MRRFPLALGLLVMGSMSLAGGFLAVTLFADTSPAEAQGAPGVVTARQFRLVDGGGRVRASMDVGADGNATFTLMDQTGRGRVQVSASDGTCSISLLDAMGTARYVSSQTESDDRVTVSFQDKAGEQRHISALTADGDSLLAFAGRGDAKWLTLLAGPEQASTIILTDPKSKQSVVAFAGRGQASLQIADTEGVGGFLSSVLGDGRSVLALSKDGKLRIRGMTKEDGRPELVFMDDDRAKTWSAGE